MVCGGGLNAPVVSSSQKQHETKTDEGRVVVVDVDDDAQRSNVERRWKTQTAIRARSGRLKKEKNVSPRFATSTDGTDAIKLWPQLTAKNILQCRRMHLGKDFAPRKRHSTMSYLLPLRWLLHKGSNSIGASRNA